MRSLFPSEQAARYGPGSESTSLCTYLSIASQAVLGVGFIEPGKRLPQDLRIMLLDSEQVIGSAGMGLGPAMTTTS